MPLRDLNPQTQQASGRRPHALYRAATAISIYTFYGTGKLYSPANIVDVHW